MDDSGRLWAKFEGEQCANSLMYNELTNVYYITWRHGDSGRLWATHTHTHTQTHRHLGAFWYTSIRIRVYKFVGEFVHFWHILGNKKNRWPRRRMGQTTERERTSRLTLVTRVYTRVYTYISILIRVYTREYTYTNTRMYWRESMSWLTHLWGGGYTNI